MKATLKLLLMLAVIEGAAAAGWFGWQSRSGSSEVGYRVAKVERGPMAAVVIASGTLNA